MKEEISSMLFTDVNGEWKRIYTSEEVIENLQNDKAELQQENKQLKEKIDILLEDNNQLEEIRIKAIEYIKNKKQFQQGCDTYQIIDWNYVLKILGDGNNE